MWVHLLPFTASKQQMEFSYPTGYTPHPHRWIAAPEHDRIVAEWDGKEKMAFPDRPNTSDRAIVPYQTRLPASLPTHQALTPAATARALPQVAFYVRRLLPISITAGTATVAAIRLAHTMWRLIKPLRRSKDKDLTQAPPAAIITEWLIQHDASGTRIAARRTIINHWKR
jgi:hypothetical protein